MYISIVGCFGLSAGRIYSNENHRVVPRVPSSTAARRISIVLFYGILSPPRKKKKTSNDRAAAIPSAPRRMCVMYKWTRSKSGKKKKKKYKTSLIFNNCGVEARLRCCVRQRTTVERAPRVCVAYRRASVCVRVHARSNGFLYTHVGGCP